MITFEELNRLLTYDPETGVFSWIFPQKGRRGNEAGTVTSHGYRQLNLNQKLYYGHRLAWLFVHGKWPAGQIDHINGNGQDNRISNLREATHSENLRNCPLSKRNKSGYKGVSFDNKNRKWQAVINVNGSRHHLGFFLLKEDAVAAIKTAREQLHGEFANHG